MTPPIETPSGLQGVEAPAEGPDGDGRSRSEVGKLAAATPDMSGVVARSSAGPATTPTAGRHEPRRDNPVTDHQQDWCEHEMSQCRGGCPPYGYCTSESHRGGVAPDWPCPTALRALGETRAVWIAKHDAELDAYVEWVNSAMASAANRFGGSDV